MGEKSAGGCPHRMPDFDKASHVSEPLLNLHIFRIRLQGRQRFLASACFSIERLISHTHTLTVRPEKWDDVERRQTVKQPVLLSQDLISYFHVLKESFGNRMFVIMIDRNGLKAWTLFHIIKPHFR